MGQSAIARSPLLLTIILSILSGLFIILQAALLSTIIDHVYLHHATSKQLSTFLWLILVITALRTITVYLRERTGFKTANQVKQHIRQTIYQYLISQQPDDLAKQKVGGLTTTVIEKIEALHDFFADYLPQMTIVIILPLIILVLVFMNNWLAGCILLITAPLIPLFMALIGMGTEALNQKHFKSLSRLSAHFLDILQGLTTLTFFNRARAQIKSIHDSSESYREKTMRVLRVAFLSSAVLELFSTVAIAIVAVYLGLGLLGLVHIGFGGKIISLQSALFILLLAPEFFMPLRQLGTFYHARSEAIAASTDLLKILKTDSATKSTTQTFQEIIRKISLKKINFAYPNKPAIYHQFNLEIFAGECLVITGPSGAGKSTLLKLITKLQTPQSGNIFVNQTNLKNIDNDEWREHIAWLSQEPYLFHDTIAANIALGKINATDNDIQRAVKMAGVLEFSQQLPHGLNTLIGEQHLGLSGGQAQRIAIARAYLKDAPIILFDEPTTHLDATNKQYIFDAIAQWRGKKIIVIASHDPDLVKIGDRVIDMK